MQCCVWGYSGDHPPHDEQGFQDFAASVEKPDVYQVLQALSSWSTGSKRLEQAALLLQWVLP